MAATYWVSSSEPKSRQIYPCSHKDCIAMVGSLTAGKTPLRPTTVESKQDTCSQQAR